jgi:hypothetical protein
MDVDSARFEVRDCRGETLCLRDLPGIVQVDVIRQSLRPIKIVEIDDCPQLERLDFDDLMSNSNGRQIFVGANRSDVLRINGRIGTFGIGDPRKGHGFAIGGLCGPSFLKMVKANDALYSSSLPEIQNAIGNVGNVVYLAPENGDSHLEIGVANRCSEHLGISGSESIESVHVRCPDVGVESITLRGLENLKSIKVDGFVRLLEIKQCPNLKEIVGQGAVLSVHDLPANTVMPGVGLWEEVRGVWIDYSNHLTTEELRTCEDLKTMRFRPLNAPHGDEYSDLGVYGRGLQWAEFFGWDIALLDEGVPFHTMLDSIIEMGDGALELLEEWFCHLHTISEQYLAHRLIAAVAFTRTVQPNLIWRSRDCVLSSNRMAESSAVFIQHSNNQSHSRDHLFGHMSPLERRLHTYAKLKKEGAGGHNTRRFRTLAGKGWSKYLVPAQWYVPDGGHIPFDRVDIEIWIETGGVSEPLGEIMPEEVFKEIPMHEYRISIEALQTVREKGPQRIRQEGLLDLLFSRLLSTNVARYYELMAKNVIECNGGFREEIMDKFIDTLLESNLRLDAKVAIGAAILQHIDNMRIRVLMSTAKSESEITRAEAKTLHALSLSGRRAFERGLVPPLEWPILENWRKLHEQR